MLYLVTAVLALLTLYGVFAVAMYCYQRKLIYRTNPLRVAPSDAGLPGIEEIALLTPDGERLIAWHGAAADGQPTLLYFHGQSGNLARRAERIRFYQAAGLGVLMLGYRGSSGSTGLPSEAANVADAKLCRDWLVEHGVPAESIVVYGESLGTGVAARLAAETSVGGVILDSPFTSLVEVAVARHPWLPVEPFVLDRYETIKIVDKIEAPILVLHCEQDPIVPVAMGYRVYEAASEPKRIATFAEGRHLNHTQFGSFAVVREFLDSCMATSRLPTPRDEGLSHRPTLH